MTSVATLKGLTAASDGEKWTASVASSEDVLFKSGNASISILGMPTHDWQKLLMPPLAIA